MDSYDLISYPALPLPRSHPGHLAALARLHGLSPAPLRTCRVLELGCANGGNLIPMAARLPEGCFVGLERSMIQAREGQRMVQALGLSHCTLLHKDLMDYQGEEGPFDYIIAHGLYSWAPPEVGQRLLALCGEHLAPHGLAFISFNCLPGWHMRAMVREMLLEQCRRSDKPLERLLLAQTFLEDYLPTLEESDALAARHLAVEIRRLLEDNPAYLYHEYLEEENRPLLFTTFANQAAQVGLRHVCDADPAYWFPDVLGPQGVERLESIADPLEREQQLDYMMLRNFREAVLCRQTAPVAAELDFTALEELAVFSTLRPPPRLMLNNSNTQTFFTANGGKIGVSHPLTRAALAMLWETSPLATDWSVLVQNAVGMVQKAGSPQRAKELDHLAGEIGSLFLRGLVGVTWQADPLPSSLTETPQPTPLARLYGEEGWLPTLRHAPLMLETTASRLFGLLDGKRDGEALALAMLGPDAPPDSGKIASQLRRLRTWIGEQLTLWQRLGLLEPE